MRYRAVEESPAGLAAFSLWIHGGPRCRPPISRMGNKAGFAHAIGAIAGIRAGEGAGAYVWSEADADVRGLLRAYPDAEMLRRVAEIIRGWVDEEPRALWERLRTERKARIARGETVGAPEVAGWAVSAFQAYKQGEPDSGFCASAGGAWPDKPQDPAVVAGQCDNLATYAQIAAANRLINVSGPDLRNTGKGGTTFGGAEFSTPAGEVATGFERVAETVILHRWSFSERGPERGYGGPGCEVRTAPGGWTTEGRDKALGCDATASKVDALGGGWPPVYVSPTIIPAADLAELLGTPGDLEGVLCYGDPPYVGTTGYLADYPRAAVVADAIDRARMGARVMVSESAPVAELVALGWHATRIDFARKGQKRTFAANAGEWVTSSFPPVDQYRQVEQMGMFG